MIAITFTRLVVIIVVLFECGQWCPPSVKGQSTTSCEPTPCDVSKLLSSLLSEDKACRYELSLQEIGSPTLSETLARARSLCVMAQLSREGNCEPALLVQEILFGWGSSDDKIMRVLGGVSSYRFNSIDLPFSYGPAALRSMVYPAKNDPILKPAGTNWQVEDKPLATNSFNITNLLPPFTVEFLGGNPASVNDTGGFRVDASATFDPDKKAVMAETNIKFTWYCNVTGKNEMLMEKQEQRLYGPKEDQRRRRRRAIPHDVTVPSFCCQLGQADCKPMSETGRKAVLQLRAEDFPHKDVLDYGIWLVITNELSEFDKHLRPNSHGQQILKFFPNDHVHASMRIRCLYNCWTEIDASDKAVFQAYCEKRPCTFKGLVWEAIENPMQRNGKPKKMLEFNGNCIVTGQRDRLLVFARDCLSLDQEHSFALGLNYGGYTDIEHVVPSGMLLISTRKKFTVGSCSVTPDRGYELLTVFTVTCTGFQKSSIKPYSILSATYHQTVVNSDGREHEMTLHFNGNPNSAVRLHVASGHSKDKKVAIKIRVTEDKMVYVDTYVNVMIEPLRSDGECTDAFMTCMVDVKYSFLDQVWFLGDVRRSFQAAQIMVNMLNRNFTNEPFLIFAKQNLRMIIVHRIKKAAQTYAEQVAEQITSLLRLVLMGDPLEVSEDLITMTLKLLDAVCQMHRDVIVSHQDSSARSAEYIATKSLLVLSELFRVADLQSTDEYAARYYETFGKLSKEVQSADEYARTLCKDERSRVRDYLHIVYLLEIALRNFVFQDDNAMVLKGDGITVYFQKITQGTIQRRSSLTLGGEDMKVIFKAFGTEADASRVLEMKLILFHQNALYPGRCTSFHTNGTAIVFDAVDSSSQKKITKELGEVLYSFRTKSESDEELKSHEMIIRAPDGSGEQQQDIQKITLDSYGVDSASVPNVHLKVFASPKENGKPFRLRFSNTKPDPMFYDKPDVANSGFEVTKLVNYEETSIPKPNREMYVSVYLDKNVAEQVLAEQRGKPNATFHYQLSIYQYSCFHWNEQSNKWDNSVPHRSSLSSGPSGQYVECIYPAVMSTHSVNVKPVKWGRDVEPIIRKTIKPVVTTLPVIDNPGNSTEKPAGKTSGIPPNRVPFEFLVVALLLSLLLLIVAFCLDGCCKHVLMAIVPKDVDPDSHVKHAYLVSVRTGSRRPANSAAITFAIHGKNRDGHAHLISYVLERRSEEHFLVFTGRQLGQIESVLVVQRNMFSSGDSAAVVPNNNDDDAPLRPWSPRDVFVYDVENDDVTRLIDDQAASAASGRELALTEKKWRGVKDDDDRVRGFCERLSIRFQECYLLICCCCSFCCRPLVGGLTLFARVTLLFLFVFVALCVNLALLGFPYTRSNKKSEVRDLHSMLSRYVEFLIIAGILLPFVTLVIWIARRLYLRSNSWIIYIDLDDDWKANLEAWSKRDLSGSTGKHQLTIQEHLVADDIIYDQDKPSTIRARQRLHLNIHTNLPPGRQLNDNDDRFIQTEGRPQRARFWNYGVGVVASTCRTSCDRNRPMFFSVLGLIIFGLIVVFAIAFVVLGLRLSADDTRDLIVTSLIGLAICLLLFHPLFLIAFAAFLPLSRRHQTDNRSSIRADVPAVLEERRQLILETGTIEEYRKYLRLLRRRPGYPRKRSTAD